MKYQLRTKNYNTEAPELLLNNLLLDRGIEQPAEWLHPTDKYEYSPFQLSNMKKAIELLHDTIKIKDSNIALIVDSDLDGYSSGAIIYSLLSQIEIGQNIMYFLHPGKEHGIELQDIPEDIDLVIVPDAGSSQKAEHLKLLENGIKIIILDHHEIENDMDYGQYQNNIAIVSSQIDYPNPALSGAGVALKFVQAYSQTYGIQLSKSMYALAACGIVADVMNLAYLENKRIVDQGVEYMAEHAFLMGLIKQAHYNVENPIPSIKDIGWVIGPNINSIIRLGTQNQKHVIFQALTNPTTLVFSSKKGHEDEQVPIYDEAIRLCDNAKKRQTTAINKSIKIIQSNLIPDDHNSIIYIDEDQELTFELSGLIANKLLSDTNKPVILLKHYVDNKGIDQYRGSVRGKPVEGLTNLKDIVKDVTGVAMAEGHAFAFGINIEKDAFPTFKTHLNSILDKINFNTNLYIVDLVTDYRQLNPEIGRIMAADNIWCHGVDKPQAILQNVPTDKYEIMGANGQHVKIDCGQYDIVMFNVPTLAAALERGEKYNLNVVGEFDIDKSYHIGRLQFITKDYEEKEHTQMTIWDYAF